MPSEIFQAEDDLNYLLQEKFTSEFRKGYISVDGVCLPDNYAKFADAIENFEVRPDDTWVCSFPKTGTTWTQEMVWCIANNLDFKKANVVLWKRFPFLELSSLFDYSTILPRTSGIDLSELAVDSVKYVDKLESPRFIKCHLPFNLLPKQIRSGEKKPKIIYVARNPKDTCVSYYHHCRLLEGYRGNFDEFCNLFIGGKLCFAPYWKNVLSYWQKRAEYNLLFIKYEDMKSNLESVIIKTANFLEKSLSSREIKILEKHLSFEQMKANPAVNYDEVIKINKKYNLINADGQFMRSGKVNQWKEIMTKEMIIRFDSWIEMNSNKSGLIL